MAKQESTSGDVQPAVHLVLQGKGGVGKSFVAAILAQYFKTRTAQVHCLDTDPVNATFAQYRILGAEHLNVLKRGAINEKRFDDLVEIVCRKAGIFVIDTGATTFVPLWNYFLENQIVGFFQQQGRRMFIHSIVSGGQAMSDTLNGLERIAETTSDRNVIVWLNEYFGEVTKDGKTFEEFKVIGYHLGMRRGEILKLRWDQVDWQENLIRLEKKQTKGKQARVAPLYGELRGWLEMAYAARGASEFIVSWKGEGISEVKTAWNKARQRANVPFLLVHDLRRTAVRNMVRAGIPEKQAMKISGHRSRSIFDRYDITDERDIQIAGQKLARYLEGKSKVVTEVVTNEPSAVSELGGKRQ